MSTKLQSKIKESESIEIIKCIYSSLVQGVYIVLVVVGRIFFMQSGREPNIMSFPHDLCLLSN